MAKKKPKNTFIEIGSTHRGDPTRDDTGRVPVFCAHDINHQQRRQSRTRRTQTSTSKTRSRDLHR